MALDPFLLQQILGQNAAPSIPGATPPFSGAPGAPLIPGAAVPQPAAQAPDILQDILAGRVNPVAEPEGLSTKEKVVGGLADFVNNYLSIKYGRPMGPSRIGQLRGAKEEAASRKTQGNLARVRAQIEERDRKAREAQEAGEASRAERRIQIDEQEARAKAKQIADGESASLEELAAAAIAYGVPADQLNLKDPTIRVALRGHVMKAQMERELEDKIKLKKADNEGADETATDRKAARALKDQFLGQIENLEADLPSLSDPTKVPDPSEVRKMFQRKVKRRFSPADAAEMTEQFETVVGRAIDEEIERRKSRSQQAQAQTPQFPQLGTVPFGGVQQIPNLLGLLGERIGYGQR